MFKKTTIITSGVAFLIGIGVYSNVFAGDALTLTTGAATTGLTINGNTGITLSLSNGVEGVGDLSPSDDITSQAVIETGHTQGTRQYAMHSDGGPVVALSKAVDDPIAFVAPTADLAFPASATGYSTTDALSN